MTFKITSRFLQGKHPDPARCEDAIFVSDAFVATIDGATAKGKNTFGGISSGRAITDEICTLLNRLDPKSDAHGAIAFLNQGIRDRFNLTKRSFRGFNRPSASVAILSTHRRQIWLLGDCQIIVDDKFISNSKKVDALNAEFRSAVNQALIARGSRQADIMANDSGRKAIMRLLKLQFQFQNNPNGGEYAYGCLDGSDNALHFLRTVSVSKARIVVLATDGYPHLSPDLETSEALLGKALKDDPLCIYNNKGTKALAPELVSYDDRAYVRIEQV